MVVPYTSYDGFIFQNLVAQSKKKKSSKKNSSKSKKPTTKQKKQASSLYKRALSKAKKRNYKGALQDLIKAYKLVPSKKTKTQISKITALSKKQKLKLTMLFQNYWF